MRAKADPRIFLWNILRRICRILIGVVRPRKTTIWAHLNPWPASLTDDCLPALAFLSAVSSAVASAEVEATAGPRTSIRRSASGKGGTDYQIVKEHLSAIAF